MHGELPFTCSVIEPVRCSDESLYIIPIHVFALVNVVELLTVQLRSIIFDHIQYAFSRYLCKYFKTHICYKGIRGNNSYLFYYCTLGKHDIRYRVVMGIFVIYVVDGRNVHVRCVHWFLA